MSLFYFTLFYLGVTSDNVCDDKWKIYHDNCYLFSELFSGTNKENWSNARTECDDRSANLTAIEDQDTWVSNLYIFDYILMVVRVACNAWGSCPGWS